MDMNSISKKCDFCDRLFSSQKNLKIHINRIHKDKKVHNCGSCGKSLFNSGNLQRHIHAVHDGPKITNVNLMAKYFLKPNT